MRVFRRAGAKRLGKQHRRAGAKRLGKQHRRAGAKRLGKQHRLIGALAISAALAVGHAAVAAAQPTPPLPPAPPYLPTTDPYPGSYSYLYNVIIAPPPAMVDARGVNTTATVYPGQPLAGQPSSQLGNSPPTEGILNNSSALYGIAAGVNAPPAPVPGVQISAGVGTPALEDPTGKPPTNVPGPESTPPTTPVGGVPPILESPGGRQPRIP